MWQENHRQLQTAVCILRPPKNKKFRLSSNDQIRKQKQLKVLPLAQAVLKTTRTSRPKQLQLRSSPETRSYSCRLKRASAMSGQKFSPPTTVLKPIEYMVYISIYGIC